MTLSELLLLPHQPPRGEREKTWSPAFVGVILGFWKHWSTSLTISLHFINQTTHWRNITTNNHQLVLGDPYIILTNIFLEEPDFPSPLEPGENNKPNDANRRGTDRGLERWFIRVVLTLAGASYICLTLVLQIWLAYFKSKGWVGLHVARATCMLPARLQVVCFYSHVLGPSGIALRLVWSSQRPVVHPKISWPPFGSFEEVSYKNKPYLIHDTWLLQLFGIDDNGVDPRAASGWHVSWNLTVIFGPFGCWRWLKAPCLCCWQHEEPGGGRSAVHGSTRTQPGQ